MLFLFIDSDYQLTGSTAGTPLATQNTPDGLPPTSLPVQQANHLQSLPTYTHNNEYNNYPTLPVSKIKFWFEVIKSKTWQCQATFLFSNEFTIIDDF